MEIYVFVFSIKRDNIGIVIEASNGGAEGPPLVIFRLKHSEAQQCYIGKRYKVTIEETD